MLDPKLLRQARANLQKEAFAPLTPEAMAAQQQPPPGGPPGGAPPMDPAMMGGMPPMDPAMGGMPPMDPAMMGGAPPMDPAMMGGAPPMDPAMGGAPPMDPAAMGGMPPLTVSAEDLMALFQEISKQAPAEESSSGSSGRVTNRDLGERLEGLEAKLDALANALGMQLPPTEVGAGAAPGMPAGQPEDLAALLPPEPEMPKAAGRDVRQSPLMKAMRLLNQNR